MKLLRNLALVVAAFLACGAPVVKADGKDVYIAASAITSGYRGKAITHKDLLQLDWPVVKDMLEDAGNTLMLAYQQNTIDWNTVMFGLGQYDLGCSMEDLVAYSLKASAANVAYGDEYRSIALGYVTQAAKEADPEMADAYYWLGVTALEYAAEYYLYAEGCDNYSALSGLHGMLFYREQIFLLIPLP